MCIICQRKANVKRSHKIEEKREIHFQGTAKENEEERTQNDAVKLPSPKQNRIRSDNRFPVKNQTQVTQNSTQCAENFDFKMTRHLIKFKTKVFLKTD